MSGYGWNWHPPPHCSGSFTWIPAEHGHIPPGAVIAGRDADDGPIFMGRAFHEGDLLPAKICPTHGGAFVPWGGQEVSRFQYEVLCSDHVAWKDSANGEVPPEAIKVGQTCDGEPLYAGRVMHNGTLTPGKIHPSHQCLYIPYGGSELRFHHYEIMVLI